MNILLQTPRLLLREFTAEDVEPLVELDSDPAVMRYITGGASTPRSVVESDVLPAFLDYYRRGRAYGFWAVVDRVDQAFLGWFHFRPGHGAGPDEPELGYRLRRLAWGRGLATEGSRALIDRGFTEFGVRRVWAETMAINLASRRVMEKCGLRFIRHFHADWPVRIPGDELGDVTYAITRAEWEADRRGAGRSTVQDRDRILSEGADRLDW